MKTLDAPFEGPYGLIQLKGTSLCMDVHCACGAHTHVDAEFCYAVKCPKCERVYAINEHVKLHELTAAEAADYAESTETGSTS